MPDINGPEVLVLLVIGVILFGPEKLPELARKAARVFNYLRGIANDAQGRLREELGPEFADLNLADLSPKALAASVLDPIKNEAGELRSSVTDVRDTVAGAAEDFSRLAGDEPAETVASVRAEVPFDTEAT